MWTAKASHFEERLPPVRGKMSPQVTKGGVWHRVSDDGEGEDAKGVLLWNIKLPPPAPRRIWPR